MDSLPLSNRAVEVIRAIGEAPGASVSARRAHGLALTQLGFFELRRGQYERSAVSLEQAREVFRGIADLELTDTDAAVNFGITTAWLLETYIQLGRPADARAAGEEAQRITQGILERQPTHMMALRANALIAGSLGTIQAEELNPQAALPYAREAIDNWQTLLRVDPSNSIAWNNLGASRSRLADVYYSMGRPRETMRVLETASDMETTAETSTMVSGILSGLRGYLAQLLGELGEPERSATVQEASEVLFGRSSSSFVAGSVEDWYWPAQRDIWRIEWLNTRGEYRRALEHGTDLWARIESRPPEDNSVEQLRDELQRRLGLALAQAGEASDDYAATEVAARAASQAADRYPDRTTTDRRLKARAQTFLAIALARQGRLDEAREILAPALVLHREFAAKNQGDEFQRLELALALYAQALADPGERTARLREARALVGALPPGMRALRSVAHVQRRLEAG
jgi:tetratricopeptide (TPR) repeat protein